MPDENVLTGRRGRRRRRIVACMRTDNDQCAVGICTALHDQFMADALYLAIKHGLTSGRRRRRWWVVACKHKSSLAMLIFRADIFLGWVMLFSAFKVGLG